MNPLRPPAANWLNPKIEIRETPTKGRGMFAREAIAAGEVVILWGGEFVDGEGARKARAAGQRTMQWDDDLFSVDDGRDDPAYLINHSCDANVWMEDAFTLAAKRPIAAGDELTADYALFVADEGYVSKWECRCGSAGCRGRVTGRDWASAAVQEKYRGHFSPLLNKRIEGRECGLAAGKIRRLHAGNS
jgi:hypothetical protein